MAHINPESLGQITPNQEYAWGLICAGLDYQFIAAQLGESIEHVQGIIYANGEESLAFRLGIDPNFYDPTTALAILGFASGRYELPEPQVKATFYPDLASRRGTFEHPEISFGEAATAIAHNLCLGLNNAAIAEETGKSYQKVKQYLSKFYRTKTADIDMRDMNSRVTLVVNILASEARYNLGETNLLNQFTEIWNQQFIS